MQPDIAHQCTSILWSIDSCQNRVSADQYHLTVLRAQLTTYRGPLFFFKLSADKLLVSNDRSSSSSLILIPIMEIGCVYESHVEPHD